MVRRTVAGLVALALAGACSLVTDLDGLAGTSPGGVDGGPPLDSSSNPEAAPIEASVDDATSDAGACRANVASICDDFERTDPRGAWDEVKTQNAGTLVIEGSPGSRRMRATTGAAPAGAVEPLAELVKRFGVAVTKLRVEATIGVEGTPLDGEYRIVWKLALVNSSSFQLVYLSVDSAGPAIAIQDFAPSPPVLEFNRFKLAPGAHRVVVSVEVAGPLEVLIDGASVLGHPAPPWFRAGTATLELGIASSPLPCTPFGITVDDFVFSAD